jgi:trk system potassium uptake protein TrkH
MFVAATNFTLLWQTLFSDPTAPTRDTEFRVYLSVFAAGSLLVSTMLWSNGRFGGLEETTRHGTFQTATLLTTTGYASTDFAVWSEEILVVLLLLMFASGSVGSTSGGLKLMRWTVGAKVIARELFQMIHPSSVRPMWLGRRTVKEPVVRGILIVILTYLLLVILGTGFVAVDTHRVGIDLTVAEALSGTLVVLGNIGPGFGTLGPMGGLRGPPDPDESAHVPAHGGGPTGGDDVSGGAGPELLAGLGGRLIHLPSRATVHRGCTDGCGRLGVRGCGRKTPTRLYAHALSRAFETEGVRGEKQTLI